MAADCIHIVNESDTISYIYIHYIYIHAYIHIPMNICIHICQR